MDDSGARTEATSRTFPCERCGADLVFELGAWELACPYCGFAKGIALEEDAEIGEQDLLSTLERQASERTTEEEGASEVHCASCHATVVFRGSLTASRCAYCGSPIHHADVHRAEHRIAADAVLPFAIERDAARPAVRRWLRSLWFAPRSFTRSEIPDRITSVYLPYWTFDAATFTRYAGERGTRTQRENEVRWQPVAGSFQRLFADVPVAADSALPRAILQGLEPWPLSDLRPYAPELMAGHLARTTDVSLAEGWKLGRDRIEDALRRQVKRRIAGDRQRIHTLWTRFDALAYQHVLLPVWLLTLRHGGRPYRVVVNGATGEVQGERAWSANKIAAAVVGALAVAAAIGLAVIAGR
jgi:DNA-directed RNA polymerase subunit RPC12/RpoP